MVAKCHGRTKDQKLCGATPRPGPAWCPWHDPTLADRRIEWSAKGGANRSNRANKELPAEPITNAELHAYMSLAFRRTLAGKMEPNVFTALSNGARTVAELARAIATDEQLAALARQVAELSGKRSA